MSAAHSKKTVSHTTESNAEVEAASTSPASTTAPAPVTFLTTPPSDANIPTPPKGFDPPVGANYRGVLPLKTELAALAGAVTELGNFLNYAVLLGAGAPPANELAAALGIGAAWTSMRNACDAWDLFCRAQEGIVWTVIRAMLERVKPAFNLAVTSDPSLATKYPNLATLLGAKKATARQAVATKLLNKQAIAEGKPPTHGAVGKKRQRAAEKEAVATLAAQGTSTPAAQAAQPVAVPSSQAATAPVTGTTPATH